VTKVDRKNPTAIRDAFRTQAMSWYFALRALLEIGFTQFAAEQYLHGD
jgi:hypothetical protein